MTIAIDALIMSAARVREQFNAAAVRLAGADLPRIPDPAGPVPTPDGPPVVPDVDVSEQLVAMVVSSQVHKATTAALRSAFSMYSAAVDLVPRDR